MTQKDRINSACWYRLNSGSPCRGGVVRFFGQYADQDGACCVVVVEDDKTMCMHEISVVHVCFATCPPPDWK